MTVRRLRADQLLDIPPRSETTYREKPRPNAEYKAQVYDPGRFVALMWVRSVGTLFLGVALLLALLLELSTRQTVMAVVGSLLIGLGIGAAVGATHYRQLHDDFQTTPAEVEERTVTHEPLLRHTRAVNVTTGERVRAVVLSPKILNGHAFAPSVVDAMRERCREDGRVTREVAGASGSGWPAVRDALQGAGYVDDNCHWTAEGRRWLMED